MRTADEYRANFDTLLLLGGGLVSVVEQMPLEEMAKTIEEAHAMGPIFDPTAYRSALQSGSLEKQRAAIAAVRALVAAWRKAELPTPEGDPG